MSIFKEAARLADEWDQTREPSDMGVSGDRLAEFLRTIAAMDLSVKPAGYSPRISVEMYSPVWPMYLDKPETEQGRDPVPFYTGDQLEAAILKAHDAAIDRATAVCAEFKADDVAHELCRLGAKWCEEGVEKLKGQP